MAPEYVMRGSVSPKIDIFSFGVLVLETVTRRRNCSSSNHCNVNLLSDVSELTCMLRLRLFPQHLNIRMFRPSCLKLVSSEKLKLILTICVTGLGSLDNRDNTTNAARITGWTCSKPGVALHPRRLAVRPA